MKAIVMAGGEGSRLRPLTCDRPKPMVPILNIPIMEHIINLLRENGITDIAVTLQYKPEVIQDYFGDGKEFGVNILYAIEETPLGTAGSVKNLEDFLDDTFLVISGDALTDFNLKEIIAFHKDNASTATITLTKVTNPLEFGIVICDSKNRITNFLEKPSWSEVFTDTINTGIYVLEPEILKIMDPFKKYDFSQDIFPHLLKEEARLYGYIASGYWCDIGSPEQYIEANFDALTGKVKLASFQPNDEESFCLGKDSYISNEAKIIGPVFFGENCKVRRGAEIIGPTVIGHNCIIDMNASIKKSLLWDNSYVGENTVLRGAQVSSRCKIKENSTLLEGSFIGPESIIEENSIVKSNIKVWPSKVVKAGTLLSSNLIWGKETSCNIFDSKGVSGLINIDIDPSFASKLGSAFGSVLKKKAKIIISHDGTSGSKMLMKALVSGLFSTGADIIDIGVAETPLNVFAIKTLKASAGVHLGTSKKQNIINIEFFDHLGINVSKSLLKKIETTFLREEFRKAYINDIGEKTYTTNVLKSYLKSALYFITKEKVPGKSFTLALYSNKQNSILANLLKALNHKIIYAEHKSELRDTVLKNKANFGLALEFNSERFTLITDKGEELSCEDTLGLFTYLLLENNKGKTLALPVTTSLNLEKMCENLGSKIVKTKTNSHSLKEICLEDDIYFASDGNNGFIFPEFLPTFDSNVAICKLLNFLSMEEKSISETLTTLPPFNLFKTSIPCNISAKGTFMRRFLEEVKGSEVELFDGIKVFRNNTWVLVLPDPNQPLLHLYGEELLDGEASFIKKSLTLVEKIIEETNVG